MPVSFMRALAASAVAAGLVLPAAASETRATLQEIQSCAAVADAMQRLACYDGKQPKVRAALDQATEADKVELFGLTLWEEGPETGEATRPEDFGMDGVARAQAAAAGSPSTTGGVADVVTEIASPVVDSAKNNAGRLVVVLSNGQVWRQVDAKAIDLPKNVEGVVVRIRKGSLGGYLMNRDGQNRSMQVVRIR